MHRVEREVYTAIAITELKTSHTSSRALSLSVSACLTRSRMSLDPSALPGARSDDETRCKVRGGVVFFHTMITYFVFHRGRTRLLKGGWVFLMLLERS